MVTPSSLHPTNFRTTLESLRRRSPPGHLFQPGQRSPGIAADDPGVGVELVDLPDAEPQLVGGERRGGHQRGTSRSRVQLRVSLSRPSLSPSLAASPAAAPCHDEASTSIVPASTNSRPLDVAALSPPP